MRLSGNQASPGSSTPAPQEAPAPGAAAPASAAPSMGDRWTSGSNAVNVVTYNTGADDRMKAPQGEFTALPMFQSVIRGQANAPIIACQEVGPALAKKLEALAKQSGQFQVFYTGKTWWPKWLPTSPFQQVNMVVVPKRYAVAHHEQHTYGGRLAGLWRTFKAWAFHHQSANAMLLATQHRGYQELRLKDARTGKAFTLINTHTAFYDPKRRQEAPQLRDAIVKAEAQGPTIVTGDFNTTTRDSNRSHDPGVEHFWQTLDPAGLSDMGPTGAAGASDWHSGNNIDQVQARGFRSTASHMFQGSEMQLPGRPDAKDLSDHYAEGDSLEFKA